MSIAHRLRQLWRENLIFILLALAFILTTGLTLFFIDQGDAVLWFSARRTQFGDAFFAVSTRLGEEFAFITVLIFLLFVRYRYAVGVPIVAILATLVAWLTKTFFAHPRPLAYFRELGQEGSLVFVEGVHVHEGFTSFPSGHTMAGFALFTFAALCTRNKTWAALGFFLLAAVVGLSRIYLVQHFLKDVHFGAILGFLIGLLTFVLLDRPDSSGKWDQSLSSLGRPQSKEV